MPKATPGLLEPPIETPIEMNPVLRKFGSPFKRDVNPNWMTIGLQLHGNSEGPRIFMATTMGHAFIKYVETDTSYRNPCDKARLPLGELSPYNRTFLFMLASTVIGVNLLTFSS